MQRIAEAAENPGRDDGFDHVDRGEGQRQGPAEPEQPGREHARHAANHERISPLTPRLHHQVGHEQRVGDPQESDAAIEARQRRRQRSRDEICKPQGQVTDEVIRHCHRPDIYENG